MKKKSVFLVLVLVLLLAVIYVNRNTLRLGNPDYAVLTYSYEDIYIWEELYGGDVDAVVVTHVSNVFGYTLPVEQLAAMCRMYGVPFIVDAAQSAGSLPVSLKKLGAEFIAAPGHKGLLGPQGTGLLLCSQPGKPLLHGSIVKDIGTKNFGHIEKFAHGAPSFQRK